MNAALAARLRFIDFTLDHHGWLRRELITDYFGLSVPQASHDLQAYIAAAPYNVEYDSSAKLYCRAFTFKRVFP